MPTPLVLVCAETGEDTGPLAAPAASVVALHVVTVSVPTPTLVDGFPT
jgi:hypothetical protein